MAKIFQLPTAEMLAALEAALEFHPKLTAADLKIGVMSVAVIDPETDELLPALKCHGQHAEATISKTTPKNRLLVDFDAIITVDLARWNETPTPQRVALMDHEVTHILLLESELGELKTDDLGRPRFKLRPDEMYYTGFLEVIARHGKRAGEYGSAIRMAEAAQAALVTYEAAVRASSQQVAAAVG